MDWAEEVDEYKGEGQQHKKEDGFSAAAQILTEKSGDEVAHDLAGEGEYDGFSGFDGFVEAENLAGELGGEGDEDARSRIRLLHDDGALAGAEQQLEVATVNIFFAGAGKHAGFKHLHAEQEQKQAEAPADEVGYPPVEAVGNEVGYDGAHSPECSDERGAIAAHSFGQDLGYQGYARAEFAGQTEAGGKT